MTRKHKFTDTELKNLLIDAQINTLASMKTGLLDGLKADNAPRSVRREVEFTIDVLDKNIASFSALKENR